jgi:hypothetical protein
VKNLKFRLMFLQPFASLGRDGAWPSQAPRRYQDTKLQIREDVKRRYYFDGYPGWGQRIATPMVQRPMRSLGYNFPYARV